MRGPKCGRRGGGFQLVLLSATLSIINNRHEQGMVYDIALYKSREGEEGCYFHRRSDGTQFDAGRERPFFVLGGEEERERERRSYLW